MLQNHSRWIMRFLLIGVVMMLISVAHAQEEENEILVIPFTGTTEIPFEADRLLSAAAQRVAEMGIEVRYDATEPLFRVVAEDTIGLWFPSDSMFTFFIDQLAITLSDPMLRDSFAVTAFYYPCPTCADDFDFITQALTGYFLYVAGEYDAAEIILEPLLERETSYERSVHDVYLILGNINILQNDYQTASDYFRIFTDELDYGYGNINLAWLELQLGNEEEAFARVNRWLEEEEINLETDAGEYLIALVARARLYALTFDYSNAITDIDTAIEIAEASDSRDTTLAELYTTRGEIVFLIYEWDRVEDNFNTAIELAPAYAPAYFQRGILFYTVARREDAQADFETYLELAPDGIYAEQATSYIESIEIELEALGN
ncbi:MAG: hypothetical protein AAFR81_09180 [Chloroflexota bacterium]